MAAIKVGPAEEQLIGQIEEFKGKYKDRLWHMEESLEIAIKQFPDDAKGEVKNIQEKISNIRRVVNRLQLVIERIAFSKDESGEKFSVTWCEFRETNQQYYQYTYGSGTDVLNEKKLMRAITSWESEAIKAIVLLRQMAGYSFKSLCSEMEQHIYKIVNEYVDSETT
ncbi:MAG: hypothetical protein IJE68_02300 [Clostridia bacterium]|nr:hypothetical protein [Clostridia bacterium]